MNLVAAVVFSTAAGQASGLPPGVPRYYWSVGLSGSFFTGEKKYAPAVGFDATVAYDFGAGSNVEFLLGYGRLGDLQSSALNSIPVLLSVKLGREWLWRAQSGRYYALLSGGVIMHSYDLSSHDRKEFEDAFGYGDYDYTVDSAPAWCLGAGVELYSATNTKMYLSLDLSYMWHEAEAEHDIDGSKTPETLDLDALVFRVGLTYQF